MKQIQFLFTFLFLRFLPSGHAAVSFFGGSMPVVVMQGAVYTAHDNELYRNGQAFYAFSSNRYMKAMTTDGEHLYSLLLQQSDISEGLSSLIVLRDTCQISEIILPFYFVDNAFVALSQGHVYVCAGMSDATIVYRDGAELHRYADCAMLTSFCVDGSDVYTVCHQNSDKLPVLWKNENRMYPELFSANDYLSVVATYSGGHLYFTKEDQEGSPWVYCDGKPLYPLEIDRRIFDVKGIVGHDGKIFVYGHDYPSTASHNLPCYWVDGLPVHPYASSGAADILSMAFQSGEIYVGIIDCLLSHKPKDVVVKGEQKLWEK